jgi:hypothetical protein
MMSEPGFDLESVVEANGGISTSCRDCIFAENVGNEQDDCALGRIDKFEEQGAEIVGLDDSYRRYLLIAGRFCNAHRTEAWGDAHPHREWVNEVAKEYELGATLIVYCDADSDIDLIEATLHSATTRQTLKPRSVIVVLNGAPGETKDYVALIQALSLGIPWEVREIVPHEDGSRRTFGEAVDLAVANIKGVTYYGVSRAGYEWPSNYLSVINYAINHEMIRLVSLLPDEDGNALFMDVRLHTKLLNGYVGKDLLEKIQEVTNTEKTHHMVKRFEDLPCVSQS